MERLLPPSTETGDEKDPDLISATTPNAEADQVNPDASATVEDKNASQPSSGQDNEPAKPTTMAEVIEAALAGDKDKDKAEGDPEADKAKAEPVPDKKPETPEPTADKNADPEQSKQPAGDGEADDDPTEEELKGYQARPQKRIKQLLSQRNAARQEVEGFREDATHYRNIRGFMAEAKLEDGEVAELFKVGRLLKGTDPQGFEDALDIVIPIANRLLELTGRSLPKELKEQVESGALTEEHAREQAKLRTRAALAERERDEVRTATETREQQQQRTAHQNAVQTAVRTWEASTRQSDPDFGLKADAMRDAALAMVAEKGAPKTPEEAVEFAKATYDKVSKWFSAARPAAKSSRPAPPAGNGNRAGLAPAPKNLADAINGALAAKTAT